MCVMMMCMMLMGFACGTGAGRRSSYMTTMGGAEGSAAAVGAHQGSGSPEPNSDQRQRSIAAYEGMPRAIPYAQYAQEEERLHEDLAAAAKEGKTSPHARARMSNVLAFIHKVKQASHLR